MPLNAGELNEQITLQARSIQRDDLNAEIGRWVDQAIVWAKVEAITGREVHAAQQLHAQATLRVTIRPGVPGWVTPAWRALWNDSVLSIEAVLPVPERDRLVLLCSQRVNDGA